MQERCENEVSGCDASWGRVGVGLRDCCVVWPVSSSLTLTRYPNSHPLPQCGLWPATGSCCNKVLARVTGGGCVVTGRGCVVTGRGCVVAGRGCVVTGRGCVVGQGHRSWICCSMEDLRG